MPSTVVHFAFGLLVAAVLLDRLDRDAVLVVAGVTAFADLDTLVSLAVESAHRAAFHTLLLPLLGGGLLYYDTRVRPVSTFEARYGERGVDLAWVGVAVFVVAAVGLDLFHPLGVNLFYPVYDQFFALNGKVFLSTDAGFVQTFVDVSSEPKPKAGPGVNVDAGQRGSTERVHVPSGVNPSKGREPEGTNRVFPVAYRGWQLLLVVAAVSAAVAKRRLRPRRE